MKEMVLPVPCVKAEGAQSITAQIRKIGEELEELRDAYVSEATFPRLSSKAEKEEQDRTNEEIADTITACITLLEIRGVKEDERSELFARVNEKNRARGYW